MITEIERMVRAYEERTMTRRQLIAGLGGLVAAMACGETTASDPRESDSTFRAEGIDHVALAVTDVPRSGEFYRKHLGLTVLRDGGEASCFLKCGDDFLALFRADQARMHHYCFAINNFDIDRVVARLKERGLTCRREGNRVYFDDPDGLTVQVAARNEWR